MRRSVLCLCALASACSKSSHKLVILHTNDEHSHLIGFGPEPDDFPVPATARTGIKGRGSPRLKVGEARREAAEGAGPAGLTGSAGRHKVGPQYHGPAPAES